MASTRGRQVVIPLTNKSGGGVIAGDVVIIDTTNDGAFTTTTTGAFGGSVGVAQETIANNGAGRVLVSGYAALVNVNASVTRGHYLKTYTAVKQATGSSSRVAGVFGQFLTGGTTPTAWLWGFPDNAGATGSTVATDAIWDVAGDLAVGSGADTAARLAKGNAGGVLAMANGAVTWNAGTSFPGSPATGDRYYRTDILGGTEFKYDGTRWRSVQTFSTRIQIDNLSYAIDTPSTGISVVQEAGWANIPFAGTYDIFVLSAYAVSHVVTTNNGTSFWTCTLYKRTPAQAATALGNFTTAADTADRATAHAIAVNAVVASAGSTHTYFGFNPAKSSAPGNLWVSIEVMYQIIAT